MNLSPYNSVPHNGPWSVAPESTPTAPVNPYGGLVTAGLGMLSGLVTRGLKGGHAASAPSTDVGATSFYSRFRRKTGSPDPRRSKMNRT